MRLRSDPERGRMSRPTVVGVLANAATIKVASDAAATEEAIADIEATTTADVSALTDTLSAQADLIAAQSATLATQDATIGNLNTRLIAVEGALEV